MLQLQKLLSLISVKFFRGPGTALTPERPTRVFNKAPNLPHTHQPTVHIVPHPFSKKLPPPFIQKFKNNNDIFLTYYFKFCEINFCFLLSTIFLRPKQNFPQNLLFTNLPIINLSLKYFGS